MTRPSGARWSCGRQYRLLEGAVRDLEDGREAVGSRLVGSEETEALPVGLDHIAQVGAQDTGGLGARRAWRGHLDGVLAKVGQREITQEESAVGDAGWRSCGGAAWAAAPSAPAPASPSRRRAPRRGSCAATIELGEVLRVGPHLAQRHLVRAERSFHLLAVDDFRPGPAFWRAQDDHRPGRPAGCAPSSRAARWIAWISSTTWSSTSAMRRCAGSGSWPSTK